MTLMKATVPASEQVLRKALHIIESGGIVAYPTETFYGLGAKYDMEGALARLYAVKRRLPQKAMPLVIGDKSLLTLIAGSWGDTAQLLMERFWPGPLTLVLNARTTLSRFITAGTGKVAVRVPGESFALRLAGIADFPITATSANPSGMPPARDAGKIMEYFGAGVDLIVDAGPAPGELPSTIVDVTADTIVVLREGAIGKELLLSPDT